MMDSSKRQDGIGGSRLFLPTNQPQHTVIGVIPVLNLPHICVTTDLLPWKTQEDF
jgi:hypothetical protein